MTSVLMEVVNASLFGFDQAEITLGWLADVGQMVAVDEMQFESVLDEPTMLVRQKLTLAAGTRIERVTVHVSARPPGWTKIASAAEVRAGSGSHVIDFGRMRTVSGLSFDGDATQVYPWLGAAFGTTSVSTAAVVPSRFDEVLTERLRVVTTAHHDDLGDGSVYLPGAPADVEVTVGGQRIWFQGGELKRGAIGKEAEEGDYFVAAIDATEAVRAAAAAGPEVWVELRAATAGKLHLAIDTGVTRVHDVMFPGGAEHTVTFAEEGTSTLTLPLPSDSGTWRIAELHLDVSARIDGRRVAPATGPALSTAATLLVDPDHPVALQITSAQLGTFGSIAGVRISVRGEETEAELAGVLLADDGGAPGTVLPGGELPPIILTPGDTYAWTTLALRKSLALTGAPLWLALQVSRGKVGMKLAASGGGAIRRGRAGGPWRAFSGQVAFQPTAAMRVIGEGVEGSTLSALAATVSGAPQTLILPTPEGAAVQIRPASALTPTGGAITVSLTATAPGAYRVSGVQAFYKLAGDETA